MITNGSLCSVYIMYIVCGLGAVKCYKLFDFYKLVKEFLVVRRFTRKSDGDLA